MFERHFINEELSDKELFSLIQKGNKKAFTVVYNRYNKLLYTLAYRYLVDQSMAEDAVQYVFVKLWESHGRLDVLVSLKNYLYTMTKNYVLNQIRNQNSAVLHNYKIYQSSNLEDYEDGISKAMEDEEMLERLYSAVYSLPEQKKQVTLLKLEGKFSNQEIADKMNISVNTVKTHYAQTLKMLKGSLSKLLILIGVILF